jgi:UDP-N-acetylglucosamine 2-epimerase (non-hydrolysing)
MRQGQDLFSVMSDILMGLRQMLANARPDIVLVHGDTATTLASTLAAYSSTHPGGACRGKSAHQRPSFALAGRG